MFKIIQKYGKNTIIIDPEYSKEYRLSCKNEINATKLSIEKWKFVLAYLESNKNTRELDLPSSTTCGLCSYSGAVKSARCKKCPVFKKTGMYSCYGTPYYEIPISLMPGYSLHIKAVRNEIDFLVKILQEISQ